MDYRATMEEVFKTYDVSDEGLASEEAARRLRQHGPNEIKEKKAEPLWKLLLHQFTDPLVVILLVAAVFTLLIGDYVDTLVILAIVVINGTIGFFQEYRADKAMQALKRLVSPKATVVRGGKEEKLDARELVPGDVVVLSTGNKIPADMRLFEVKDLQIDESMLTGESVPVSKITHSIDGENLSLAEWKNMAFMGAVITHGRGKGVVFATGERTQLGRISEQVRGTVKEKTPLQKRLLSLTRMIGAAALALAFLVIIIGLIEGRPLIDMVLFSVSMLVAVVPEGLPIVITITMAVGLTRMAEKNAIIRKLIAVETLGSCDYICSDKTGTITENRMTVTCAFSQGKIFTFTGTGYNPEGMVLSEGKELHSDTGLESLLRIGALCNTANLYFDTGDNAWKVDGMPTEGALLVAARKYGIDLEKLERAYELVDEIPFSSSRKYMAMLYRQDGKQLLFVKGAPERMIGFSAGQDTELLSQQYTRMAAEGLRVLGLGMKEITVTDSDIDLEFEATHGLLFAGFLGMIDPPRQSAVQAIQDTHRAGVHVVMITGDNKITAAAIARGVGILKEGGLVVTGQELDTHGPAFLQQKTEEIAVYARVSPSHKIDIVEALQKRGHIVAMTGDGVNDAPALKRSNIGVAMGMAGTDVAREAADMVLRDDNFATIFEAVKVGRIIFNNIRKVTQFLLASGAGITLLIIMSIILGLPLPFVPIQVLWVNLVTNGLQDISLGYEPGEKDEHLKPPRDKHENIINGCVLQRVGLIGVIYAIGILFVFQYCLRTGESLEYARSAALNTLVFFQFFNAWNSRSIEKSIFKVPFFSNPFLLASLSLSLFAQISVLTFPPLQFVFQTTPLGLRTWGLTLLVAFSIFAVIEIDKWLRMKNSLRHNTNDTRR